MRASGVIRLHQAVENPFTERTKGLHKVHCGHLIIRGDKGSQKDGFVMKRFCVLLFDNEQRAGYILCAKTKNQWDAFQETHNDLFTRNTSVHWRELQNDEIWKDFRVIALKDAHIDNSTLPEEQKESFLTDSNEIFVKRTDASASLSSMITTTSAELDGHYLIFETNDDFIEWIGHMQKISKVEQKAMEFRMNLVRKSSKKLNEAQIEVLRREQPEIEHKRKGNKWKNIIIGLCLLFIFSGIGYQIRLNAQEERLRELEKIRIQKEFEELSRMRMPVDVGLDFEQIMAVMDEWSDYIYEEFKLYIQIGAVASISMISLMLLLYIKSCGWILIPIAVVLMILVFLWNVLPQYASIIICSLAFMIIWCVKGEWCKRTGRKLNKKWKRRKRNGRLASSY